MFLRLYKRLQCGVFLWLEQGVASGTPTLLSMNELHETKTELSNLHVLHVSLICLNISSSSF